MKTLKAFDYDLWAIEEQGSKKYFVRVKATGEETEVSIEVMRLLLSQEKQLRREYARQQKEGTILSLDAACEDFEANESAWLLDITQDVESEILWEDTKKNFCKTLSPAEQSVFQECLIEGKRKTDYASEHGVTRQTVQTQIQRIRRKLKNYF